MYINHFSCQVVYRMAKVTTYTVRHRWPTINAELLKGSEVELNVNVKCWKKPRFNYKMSLAGKLRFVRANMRALESGHCVNLSFESVSATFLHTKKSAQMKKVSNFSPACR